MGISVPEKVENLSSLGIQGEVIKGVIKGVNTLFLLFFSQLLLLPLPWDWIEGYLRISFRFCAPYATIWYNKCYFNLHPTTLILLKGNAFVSW